MAGADHYASGFGLCWRADLPLPELFELSGSAKAFIGEVEVRRVDRLADRSPLRMVNKGFVYSDGIRLAWNGEVVFDMFDGKRIDYLPQERWRQLLPASFYSTVAALTAAWCGAVPLHACAVEIDDRAFLIAGPSGAGKSSLAAQLIGLGARHVADDLTVVRAGLEGQAIETFPGRPAMRQHRATAALVPASLCAPVQGDDRGKWLVRPTARTRLAKLPLAGILLLEAGGERPDPARKAALVASHLFRPRWINALPNRGAIRRQMLEVGSRVPIETFPPLAAFDPVLAAKRADEALELFRNMAELGK
jgi:hypothetical protein